MGAWVLRRSDGTIWSACATEQIASDGAPLPDQQFLEDDDAELVAFRAFVPVPGILKRSQIMRQLSAAGKLDAARSAVDGADALTQELWQSNDWHLADLQADPFAAMVAGLGIDLPTFWAAAAADPA